MNLRIEGQLFRGQTASYEKAWLVFEPGIARFETENDSSLRIYKLSELSMASRLGNLTRVIETSDGLRFETRDFETAEKIEKLLLRPSIIHLLENSWPIAIGAASLMVLGLVFTFYVLIPKYSKALAPKVPDYVLQKMSEPIESYMEKIEEVRETAFTEQESKNLENALLEFRALYPEKNILVKVVNFGSPNAFVLPNGSIYLTSQLVQLAESSDEILSILLHEMGHSEQHHIVAALLQSSAISGLILLITGGAELSNIPIVLLANVYSREHELEADLYSVNKLKELDKDPEVLAIFFKRMEASHKDIPGMMSYLSTHPSFKKRIEKIK